MPRFPAFVAAAAAALALALAPAAHAQGKAESVKFRDHSGVGSMLIDTVAGIRGVSQDLIVLSRSLGATPSRIFSEVTLPSAVPVIFSGLRLALRAVLGMRVTQGMTRLEKVMLRWQ